MTGALGFLAAGSVLGWSGGLAPGPLSALVVRESLAHGPRAGLVVAMAPLLTDVPLLVLSGWLAATASDLDLLIRAVSLVGAGFLLFLAWESWHTEGVALEKSEEGPGGSALRGILTNFVNPHAYLFWVVIGGPLVADAWATGTGATAAFLGGFFGGLCGAKAILAVAVGRSAHRLGGPWYRRVMRGLALALVVFALLFARDAVAAEPMPEDVDLEDLDGWATGAAALLDGPGGCWEVEGLYSWAHRGPGGMRDGAGGFSARLVNGRWRGNPAGFEPLVGRGWGRADALGALDRWLEELTGPVETLTVGWDRDRRAVRMERHAQLEEHGAEAVATTWLATDQTAVAMDVQFPRHRLGPGRVLVGAGYTVTTRGFDGRFLPAAELVVYRIRDQGRVVRAHQEVEYRSWKRCR